MSLGNLNQKGIIPKSGYNKTTFSLSGQDKISDKFNVSGSVNFITSANTKVQQGSNLSSIMLGLLRTSPTFDNANGVSNPVNNPAAYVMPDGTGDQRTYRGANGLYDNPYWTVNRNPSTENLDRAYGFGQANYQLFKWMVISYRLGGDVYSQSDNTAYDINSGSAPKGAIYLVNFTNRQFNSDLTINMHKDLSKDFTGSLLLGQNYFYSQSNARVATGSGFIVPSFFDISNTTSYQNGPSMDAEKRTMAFYGDAELSFRRMFYLSITGREEESSTLPTANNTFFYPSASLGWVFTELKELKDKDVLSFGKLRISAAQVGKDAPVQGLETHYLPTTINDGFTPGVFFPINGTGAFQISSVTSVIGNPVLKPERTNSYEGGLDLGFFKNRINLSGTYYYEKTTEAIFTVPLPYSTGFASKLLNAGVLTNSGVELSLNTTPIKTSDGFRWDLNFNWAKNVNKVVSLYNGVQKILVGGFVNGEVDAIAGQPFGIIYGSKYVRADPKDNSTLLINDNPSDPGYGMPIAGLQTGAIGNVNPKWTGSMINNFTYKNFTLGFQIDWRHGGDIWDGTKGAIDYFGTGQATANRGTTTTFKGLTGHLDASENVVHGPTDLPGPGGANTATAVYNQYYWQNIGSSFIGPTEPDVEDGSFVKLRQLSLAYNLPKSFIRPAGFKTISLTIFVNNIILWTRYKGVDPETSLAGPSNGQGLDYFNNPATKNYGIRLNLGL